MALPKEWPPKEITISFVEWQKVNNTLIILRSFTDPTYEHIKCECGLSMWAKDEGKIRCIGCRKEISLCECGEVLTEEKKSPFEPTWCISCRKDWAHSNKLCPECEKELTYIDEIGWAKNMLHCADGCIDPIPEELYW